MGTRSGHFELQTAAEALHCQGWLMRRGEVGRKILLLNLLGLSPLRGWPPKCGLRTSLWPRLCYPTCSRENANTSEKLSQGKVRKKNHVPKRKLQRSCVASCTKTTSGAQPSSVSLHLHLCQTLNLTQGHHTWEQHPKFRQLYTTIHRSAQHLPDELNPSVTPSLPSTHYKAHEFLGKQAPKIYPPQV